MSGRSYTALELLNMESLRMVKKHKGVFAFQFFNVFVFIPSVNAILKAIPADPLDYLIIRRTQWFILLAGMTCAGKSSASVGLQVLLLKAEACCRPTRWR